MDCLKIMIMKKILLAVLLVGAAWTSGRTQVLGGIFDQGATELKEYGKQIVALQLLMNKARKGYSIVEFGLQDIGSIDSGEAALHREYFNSLGSVNPRVAGMSQVADIRTLASSIQERLGLSLARWNSGGLSADELAMLRGMQQRIVNGIEANLDELTNLLTPLKLTMTDDQRMARIDLIDDKMKRLSEFVGEFSGQTDVLIVERKAAGIGALKEIYGLP